MLQDILDAIAEGIAQADAQGRELSVPEVQDIVARMRAKGA